MKKKILIGYFIRDRISPITTVNQAIITALRNKYRFYTFYINSKDNDLHGKLRISNILQTFYTWIKWIYMIVKFKPHIVHYPITSYWAFEKSMLFLYTAKVFGVKTIGHLHGGAFKKFLTGLTGIRKQIAYKAMEKLDGIITLSPSWQNFIQNELHYIKNYYVYNPIDIDFENAFKKYLHNYKNDSLIFIGHIMKRKGVFDILNAVEKNKDIYIDIVGSGENNYLEFNQFKNEIVSKELIDRISILGIVTGEKKIKLFQDAGILILPSYVENFPLVIIEAACAGLPIIATRIGALPDLFTHNKNILFIDAGDVKQLEKSINYLIKNQYERKRLGMAAMELFQQSLNRSDIMKKFDLVYQDVLGI